MKIFGSRPRLGDRVRLGFVADWIRTRFFSAGGLVNFDLRQFYNVSVSITIILLCTRSSRTILRLMY